MKNIILLDNYYLPQELEVRISEWVDYYNHRRPHQSLCYVTPYDMLTGKADEIIQQRKERHIVAQKRRKEVNRRMAD